MEVELGAASLCSSRMDVFSWSLLAENRKQDRISMETAATYSTQYQTLTQLPLETGPRAFAVRLDHLHFRCGSLLDIEPGTRSSRETETNMLLCYLRGVLPLPAIVEEHFQLPE